MRSLARGRKHPSHRVHTTPIQCTASALRGALVAEDIHPFTGCDPKHKSMARRNLLMRTGQATPIPMGGNLSRGMMSSSLPALLSVPSDPFYDTRDIALRTRSPPSYPRSASATPLGLISAILLSEDLDFAPAQATCAWAQSQRLLSRAFCRVPRTQSSVSTQICLHRCVGTSLS